MEKYKKEYKVKGYETDCHGFLRLVTLFNYFQESAEESAEILGMGYESCFKNGYTWFGSNYSLKINRLPKIYETFTVETWPAELKLWGAVRDFVVCSSTGEELIRASSQWVLVDLNRGRPLAVKKHFPNAEVIADRAYPVEFSEFEEPQSWHKNNKFMVRFDDIDMNNHVNNSVYPLWAAESVPSDYRMKHFPHILEIAFKKPAVYGENVEVMSYLENNESKHLIVSENTNDKLAMCRIVWDDETESL